ncbi:hypothetical protein PL263_13720 [Methylomonas sp. EFPC3]|uniref:hypothetical protein n=1 Tax=Methylomonas sp. EFPC3 TaxID=3021710 RepID=UPI0024165EE7|nr:hypothetical protein [Methylomonas sp. EFPC3]WFP49153.1 hypothetical protein PL263_13720 [Methylomonas sp. EFPC3]
MKNRFSLTLLATWLLSISGTAGAAIELSLVPITQTASSLSVGVSISGLGNAAAPSLGAYDLDLVFDGDHLAYVGAVFGDPVSGKALDPLDLGLSPSAAALAGAGRLNLFELSLDSAATLNQLQADSFILAVLNFDFLMAGSSQLSLNINALGDANGDPLQAAATPIAVASVPLPPAFALMAAGLGLLYRRRA